MDSKRRPSVGPVTRSGDRATTEMDQKFDTRKSFLKALSDVLEKEELKQFQEYLLKWSRMPSLKRIVTLELGEQIAAAPHMVPGEKGEQVLLLDKSGNVTLWAVAQLGKAEAARTWIAGSKGMPAGRVTHGPFFEPGGSGRLLLCKEDRQLICISLDRPEPV